MEDKLKKKEEENLLEHAKRLVEYKFKDRLDYDYVELYKAIFNIEISSTESRKRMSGIRDLCSKLSELEIKNINDEDVLNQLEMKRIELEKERKKKQAVNIEYNKLVREQGKKELWWEFVDNSIRGLKPFDTPNTSIVINNKKRGLLAISDMHYGRQNIIKGLDGEIISEYNTDIFKERMWDLYHKAINNCRINDIKHLYIFNLSDCIEGILRMSQLQSLQTGVVDSVIEFSEFMATWLNEFSKNNIVIDYYQCWGNHDELRLLTGAKGDFPNENVNKLIMKFLNIRLENNDNVIIHDDGIPFIYETICDVPVFGYHGEDKNLLESIKWFRNIYKKPIDIIFGGHLHSQSLSTEGIGRYGDSQCIRVSSICGIDEYSMSLRKAGRAGASMFIFEEGLGKTQQNDFWLN